MCPLTVENDKQFSLYGADKQFLSVLPVTVFVSLLTNDIKSATGLGNCDHLKKEFINCTDIKSF